ncbi:hypothetical protein LTR85_008141 [Meristemomyces frigidus]|nr:hypothetical protein LTR85_008141 [Meristemomyces frigidus]
MQTDGTEVLHEVPAVNIKEHLLDLSLRLTTEFLLGEEADATATAWEEDRWTNRFAEQFNTAFRWIAKRERLKSFYWMIDGFEFRRACSAARGLVDEAVCRSMEALKMRTASTETYVALESLLRQEPDPDIIRDQFMNLLLAGRDTSGYLLCWIFYALSREPDLVLTLRKEIEDAIGLDESRTPTKIELSAMVKLDQFISETLRMFPPVPIDCRTSMEATSLPQGGGADGSAPVLIPKGTLIAFSTFAVHRSVASTSQCGMYGESASKFCIERWNDVRSKERRMVDWSYHPFLGGPRKCLGGE